MRSGHKQLVKPALRPRRNASDTPSLFKKKKKTTTKPLKQRRDGAADGCVNDNDDGGRPVQGGDVRLQKLGFFLEAYQTANNIRLSSLELESFSDKRIVDLSEDVNVDANTLGKQVKAAFGSSWKEILCDNNLVDGEINAGSPTVLVVAASAIRVLELLRGFKPFTRECRVAKLFSRHIKVEEQCVFVKISFSSCAVGSDDIVKLIIEGDSAAELFHFARQSDPGIICHSITSGNSAAEWFHFARQSDPGLSAIVTLLKNRVNIAGGTPSRIKKLIDMEALGLSRLSLILLDIRPDVKNYFLLSLPQVKDEFWDLYKIYFHDRLVKGSVQICVYGPLPSSKSKAKSESRNE